MTTKVTVDAHAGWPVKVVKMELAADRMSIERASEEVVPANESRDFYIHAHLKIEVEEMSRS